MSGNSTLRVAIPFPRPTVATLADRDEVLALLSRAARGGNVGAMKILLEELRRDGVHQTTSPGIIDELAILREKAAAKEAR
jgi:hypothetical protein